MGISIIYLPHERIRAAAGEASI